MPLRLRPDVATVDTDDSTVLLNERTGRYWQLNHTGKQVLRALLDGREPEDIADELARRHRIDPMRVLADVSAVVDQLHAAELLETP